jgi:hypothetical protein
VINQLPLLYLIAPFLHFMVYLGMLVIALTRAGRNPRGSAFVAAASIIMLIGLGISSFAPLVLGRLLRPENIVVYMGGVYLFSTVLSCLGLILLTAAALGERTPSEQRPFSTPPSRDPRKTD